MIEETATVVRVEGDRVWVRTQRKSACGHCAARSECPNGALADLGGAATCELEVASDLPLQPGENVRIGLPEEALTSGVLSLYGLPLLALIAGVALSRAWGAGEGWQLLTGLAALAGALKWVHGRHARAPQARLMPRLLKRL